MIWALTAAAIFLLVVHAIAVASRRAPGESWRAFVRRGWDRLKQFPDWRRWAIRLAIGVAAAIAGALIVIGVSNVQAHHGRQRAQIAAWRRWSFDHCRILTAGASGAITVVVVAYRCDDGHDYLSYAPWPPDEWTTR